MSFPKHLTEDNPDDLAALRRWADRVAPHYRLPVWLVGSALAEDNPEPRDYDVRLEMPDAEFAARFGPVERWAFEGAAGEWGDARRRWGSECVERTREAWAHTQLNVDFQIQPASHAARYAGLPKARLDRLGAFDGAGERSGDMQHTTNTTNTTGTANEVSGRRAADGLRRWRVKLVGQDAARVVEALARTAEEAAQDVRVPEGYAVRSVVEE